jgi:hypothetical protein
VTSPGRKRSRSEQNDEVWEQVMHGVDRVKRDNIRLVPDPDEEVQQAPTTPWPKRRRQNVRQVPVSRRQRPVHPWERQGRARVWANLEAAIHGRRSVTFEIQRHSQESRACRQWEKDLSRTKETMSGKCRGIEDMGSRITGLGDKIRGIETE